MRQPARGSRPHQFGSRSREPDVGSWLWCSSIGGALVNLGARRARERLIPPAEHLEFLFLQLFQIEERVVRSLRGTNELVELQLDGLGVAVLGVLDQKDHQERDDGRACVDDELPRVAEMKHRPRDHPRDDDKHREYEHSRLAAKVGCSLGELGVPGGGAHATVLLWPLTPLSGGATRTARGLERALTLAACPPKRLASTHRC